MDKEPAAPDRSPKKEIYIHNVYIDSLKISIDRQGDDWDRYESLANEVLKEVEMRPSQSERLEFLTKALMTLVHTAIGRRHPGDALAP